MQSYNVVTRCAHYAVVFPWHRNRYAYTRTYIRYARETNLHVNIFRENKSIRKGIREEELLKLVIAVYEAASAFIRHCVAELRNSATSFDDNATCKHPVTRYRMSRVCRDIRPVVFSINLQI